MESPESAGSSTTATATKAAFPLRRRHRTLLLVMAGALGLSLGGPAASFLIQSPAEKAAETAPPARSLLTAKVERRVVRDSVILQGEVISGRQTTVSPQSASGEGVSPVITAVRAATGKDVRAGQVLAEVSARPVFILPGSIPVYRDLKPADRGKDVRQLQAALRNLGYGIGGDARGVFGSGTKAAVARFYERIGYDVTNAGGTDDEDLKAAEQALRDAQRAYQELRAGGSPSSGQRSDSGPSATSGRGTGSGPDTGTPSGQTAGSRALQLRYAREDVARARRELARARAKTGPMVPASEVVFLPSLPARVVSVNAALGAAVASDMMVLSSGRLQVRARLLPYQRRLVKAGQSVQVFSDDTGQQYRGVIASVGRVPVSDSSTGDSGDSGGDSGGEGPSGGDGENAAELYFPVTIRTSGALSTALQGLSVRVTVERDTSTGAVLAVPSSAVSARSDGVTVVTVRRAGGALVAVPVTAGSSGDGYVEVRAQSASLQPGDDVVVGR